MAKNRIRRGQKLDNRYIVTNPKWTQEEIDNYRQIIEDNDGYCPSSAIKTNDYTCVCKEFYLSNQKECYCGLYIRSARRKKRKEDEEYV